MEDFRKGKLKYNAALYIMFNEKSQGKFTTDL